MKTKYFRIISLSLAALVSVSTAIAQDGETRDEPTTSAQLTLDELRTFTDVFNQARRNYVEEVDDKTLLDAAIRGMLLELDPHSKFLPAKDYETLNDTALGRYSGIGIEVESRDGKLVIKAIINDSPADRAGLNPGDVITSIDGQRIKGRPLPDSMDELKGEPDSEVVLAVMPPEGKERELTITRQYLQVPTLSFDLLEDSYGYFKVTQFHQESADHLEQTLNSIREEGIELSVLIIDLRNNPGGVLQQAVAMADGFLDEGVIVSTRGRNSTMQLEFSAHQGQWMPGIPVMLLVDRGTASASEVLAGALQDHARALVVGERTFGKGTVQSVLPLRNGAGIKLTTALYYTPSGRSIQAEGISPDVPLEGVAPTQRGDLRKREADLDGHLGKGSENSENTPQKIAPAFDDFPLEDVLDALREAGKISA